MSHKTVCDRCSRQGLSSDPIAFVALEDDWLVIKQLGLNTGYIDLCDQCVAEMRTVLRQWWTAKVQR